MKKILSCLLALALLLTTLTLPAIVSADEADLVAQAKADANFNETGYPIVKEKVKKTVMIKKPANISDPAEMYIMQYIADMMNIEIEWDVVSAEGWNERINLVFASNKLPDIIMKGGIPNLARVIEDGQLVALDDLMAEYSTGLKPLLEQYPGVDSAVRAADGKLYTLPGVNTLAPNLTGHNNLWINKTWLDNLGLAMPTTTDELLDVLRAFRDQDADGDGDPNNEIPYAVESGSNQQLKPNIFGGIFGVYRNFNYENIRLADGKVSFLKTDPVWKMALEYMHVMYEENLLDHETFTQTNDMSIGKLSSGNVGVFGLSSDDLFTTVSHNYVALPHPVSPSGLDPVIQLSSNSMGAGTFITVADETPWISFRMLDYFFTYEGSMTVGCFNEELIGITCQKTEDGKWDYSEAMLNDERGVAVAVGEACPLPGGGFGYWRHEDNSNYIYSAKVQENVPIWEPYYQKDAVYGAPQFDSDTADRVNEIRADLDVYVLECQAKFVTGELSFDKWDEYVKTTQKLGADELVEIYQAYYDAL